MQFPVPQFTDVEDKIIGPLTVKQFGIIFAAGVLIFLPYSVTKSIVVLVIAIILVGLPALGLAFVKINGRPMYIMFTFVFKFITSPKVLVFHKQGVKTNEKKEEAVETKKPVEAVTSTPQQRLKEVNKLLMDKAREEEDLLKRMK
jgi:hypothetical protein